jgi:uncharacterized protein (DUF2252 family)
VEWGERGAHHPSARVGRKSGGGECLPRVTSALGGVPGLWEDRATVIRGRSRDLGGDMAPDDMTSENAQTGLALRGVAGRPLNASGTPRLSSSERAARGRQARRAAPRSSHGVFAPAPDRSDPIELLERQARLRVPELVPIRYARMTVSPFTFYRGAALLMAADLANTPRSGFEVQCCGDAHLSNFGLFASPERRLVFDINDFDETLPGPWEWDLKRLAVSLLLAARDNGFSVQDQERVVLEAATQYRSWMRRFARMGTLDVWYSRIEMEPLYAEIRAQVGSKMLRRLERRMASALTRDSKQAFSKFASQARGETRLVSEPPLIVRAHDLLDDTQYQRLETSLGRLLTAYGDTLPHDVRVLFDQYHLVDIGRKVVGVGSVGTHAWIGLLIGGNEEDPLVLQVKEAMPSVLEEFSGYSVFATAGERVVAGQRIMQASSDIFLGWLNVVEGVDGAPHDYYVRQLRDWKGTVRIEAMNRHALVIYGRVCAQTLARAHARTGDRIAIASYLGQSDVFDRAIVAFSHAYAQQSDRDYAALRAAITSGRIRAATEP